HHEDDEADPEGQRPEGRGEELAAQHPGAARLEGQPGAHRPVGELGRGGRGADGEGEEQDREAGAGEEAVGRLVPGLGHHEEVLRARLHVRAPVVDVRVAGLLPVRLLVGQALLEHRGAVLLPLPTRLLVGGQRLGLVRGRLGQVLPGAEQSQRHDGGHRDGGELDHPARRHTPQLDAGQADHGATPPSAGAVGSVPPGGGDSGSVEGRPSPRVSSRKTVSRPRWTGTGRDTYTCCAARRRVTSAGSWAPVTVNRVPPPEVPAVPWFPAAPCVSAGTTVRPAPRRTPAARSARSAGTSTSTPPWAASPMIASTRPWASTRPRPMIETVSATCSTSLRMWLLSSTVRPWSPSERIVCRI